MKRAGIIGWPVTHSLSPVLHGYWLKEYGIDGEMRRLPAQPEEFAAEINRVRGEGFAGVNVTVPHKEAAFDIAQTRDRAAEICGAVNLLVFRAEGIEGRNTDHVGLHQSLNENLGEDGLAGKTVILLGAGGAARGALLALDELGVAQIHILNRHHARAESLARTLALNITAKLLPGSLESWAALAPQARLLLNTTSAGMAGAPPLALDLSGLPQDAAVCDIVYNPLETALLKSAAARGLKTIDGLGMLMHQAAPSFEAFFGVHPKVTQGLRAALIQALDAA
jgi:shikimate dehydrogenase